MKNQEITHRLRRLRKNNAIRDLVAENSLSPEQFVQPIFVVEGKKIKKAIASMPGVFHYSLDQLWPFLDELSQHKINNIILFPVVPKSAKDKYGSMSRQPDFYYFKVINAIKNKMPHMNVITDVALDPYTDHGHDGVFEDGIILNDKTLPLLVDMAIMQAEAGADIISPSDMMDGRVKAIRSGLDNAEFSDVLIMSYTAKYASSFYGPFRGAISSDILKGDKKTYQMDFRNIKEALAEAELDIKEGADILMVKPGLAYLDVLKAFSEKFHKPIAVYNVSGEYSMLKAAAQQGWLDYEKCLLETFYAFKRSGADIIISYGALDVAKMLKINFNSIANETGQISNVNPRNIKY